MTMPNLIGGIIFSSIGFVALIYGKKISSLKPMVIGAALIVFPYLIQNTLAVYIVGVLLVVSFFIFRD